MAENDKTIVSRIQHRRGLKQDLPQPLRPGEIGLAVDSKQVYIGHDPNNPNSVDLSTTAYIENTVSARDHVISIANNNIIAFTVPFYFIKKGEFDGTQFSDSIEAKEVRSLLTGTDSGVKTEFYNMSSLFPVFSSETTNSVHLLANTNVSASDTFVVNNAGNPADLDGIRIGDFVTGSEISGNQVKVLNIVKDGFDNYTITLNQAQTLTANSNIEFIPNSKVNNHNTNTFKSTDVIVRKNGIKLIPESNSSLVTVPSANSDYTFNASNITSTGYHTLTLRTAPNVTDDVSVCYYSNANISLALTGVNGNISATTDAGSFYDTYSIPYYRRIPEQNIRVSTSSGTGFFGLENKHIAVFADGANISSTSGLTLGSFIIGREDQFYNADVTANVTAVSGSTSYQYTVEFDNSNFNDVFGIDSGTYRYNKAKVTTPNSNDYLNNKMFDVASIDTVNKKLDITIPTTSWKMVRYGTANLASGADSTFTNGAGSDTNVSITGSDSAFIEGLAAGHYVRMVNPTSDTAELHNTIFAVESVSTSGNSFVIDVQNGILGGNASTFTANIANVGFVDHGIGSANVNTSFRIVATDNEFTSLVANVTPISDDSGVTLDPGVQYNIDEDQSTANTVFVIKHTGTIPTDNNSLNAAQGTLIPVLSASYTGTTKVAPVLSVDLSSASTVQDALVILNRSMVQTTNGGANTSIFPTANWSVQEDSTLNKIYVSQRPSLSSVAAGGISFSLYEDKTIPTLSVLGLSPGTYDRANNTVRAKLETWLDGLVKHRDVNMFVDVFAGGPLYASGLTSINNNNTDSFGLVIDTTYNEVSFATREEAGLYNELTNKIYNQSPIDKATDTSDGTKGLLNLKTNLELQTREAAAFGETTTTYDSLTVEPILLSDSAGDKLFSIGAGVFNSFVLDYTLVEKSGAVNKYMRVGTMTVTARTDFADAGNAVVLNDTFSSSFEITQSDPVVEPQFEAVLVGDDIEFRLVNQIIDPSSTPFAYTAHNIGAELRLKYIIRRWSSTS